jgi:hypothetical protein
MTSGSKKGTQIYFSFLSKVPANKPPPDSPTEPLWRGRPAYRAFCISLKKFTRVWSVWPKHVTCIEKINTFFWVWQKHVCQFKCIGSPVSGLTLQIKLIGSVRSVHFYPICLSFSTG